MAETLSLKPNSALLDPNFDGYKLSLDGDVSVYQRPVKEALEPQKSVGGCYLRTRLEALHNHLHPDPFHPQHLYYFTARGHLVKHHYAQDSRLSDGEVVWQADVADEVADDAADDEGNRSDDDIHYFASVIFPSQDLAVVTNGRGRIHVLETGDRSTTQSWLECYEGRSPSGALWRAQLVPGKDYQRHLHCLVAGVSSSHQLTTSGYTVPDTLMQGEDTAVHLLHWLLLTYNGATWDPDTTRVVAGRGTIEYCSFDATAQNLVLLCHQPYYFVYDSGKPVVKPETPPQPEHNPGPKFTYMQNDEEVTVWLHVGDTVKEELCVKVVARELRVSARGATILQGTLSQPVHGDITTWTLCDGRLEVNLVKAVEGVRWAGLLKAGEGEAGEEVLDPQLLEEVNQRLAHLTSDKMDANPELDKPAYNPGQLEACDEAREELLLLHLHAHTHALAATCHLGATQHLFNTQGPGDAPGGFCTRHDVDGVLWVGEGGTYTHQATFHAFGYVKASKSMAKFTRAAPDNSFVAIADVRSHIYVFFQSEAFRGSELRNRRSGKQVRTVAKQLVLSMKTHDMILGLHASNSELFVLTRDDLFVYTLRN